MKSNKRRLIGIIALITLYCTGCGASISQSEKNVELNGNYNLISMFSVDDGYELSVKEDKIDISKIGTYSVLINATKGKRTTSKDFEITVEDTTAPVIKIENTNITIEQDDNNIDLSTYVSISDNSKEKITPEFDYNMIDIKSPGEYIVPFSATDPSGNKSTGEIKVTVEEKLQDYELQAISLINYLKSILKNPDSLKIHSISCRKFREDEKGSHFKIDFSSQNGFGGFNRETYYIEIDTDGKPTGYSLDEYMMMMEMSNYENNSHTLDEALDADKLLNNLNR